MTQITEAEAYWRLYKEHCDHMRHHEVQRSTVAASMVAIAGALLSVATFDKAINIVDLPLFIMIVALGIFGSLFAAKQWERSAFQMERARTYRNAADSLLAGTPIATLREAADARHQAEFPRLRSLKIHWFWSFLYLFVCIFGVALAAVAIWWPIGPR